MFFSVLYLLLFNMNRAMDSRFSPTVSNNSNDNMKKEEVSVQLSTPPAIPKVETLRSNNLRFDRLQPSDQELVRENRFEFGQFVAREAVLDEEYWVCYKFLDNTKRKEYCFLGEGDELYFIYFIYFLLYNNLWYWFFFP